MIERDTERMVKTMKRTNKPTEPVQEERLVPNDALMEELAKLPEDVKKMALAYAHGVSSGHRMQRNERGTTI